MEEPRGPGVGHRAIPDVKVGTYVRGVKTAVEDIIGCELGDTLVCMPLVSS